MRKAEHDKYCENIAKNLEGIYNGTSFQCPCCCGLSYTNPNFDKCPVCGEELVQSSIYDYFADALDFDYIIGSDRKTLKGVRILVAFGGPNVYVDTIENEVQLRWWNEEGNADLPQYVSDAINDCFEELWNC